PTGAIPRLEGSLDAGIEAKDEGGRMKDEGKAAGLHPSSFILHPSAVDASCAYVFQIYRRFRRTGDQTFLDLFYPSARHAVEYLATLDTDGDGLPEGPNAFDSAPVYNATLWLGALRIAQAMAAAMQDKRFEAQCGTWFEKAQKTTLAHLWNGRFL